MMEVAVLIENSAMEGFACEHGLSFFIRFRGREYLLDAGSSGAFLENARRLGICMENVETCVLSHGHYDHGGGFEKFFRVNEKGKVYAQKTAFFPYFSTSGGTLHEIGIPEAVKKQRERFRLTEGPAKIGEDVFLLPHTASGLAKTGERAGLFTKRDGVLMPDAFEHEQSLIFDTEKGLVIFNSCTHAGIGAVLEEIKEAFPGRGLYAFLGGLHMKGKKNGEEICSFSEEEVQKMAARITDSGLKWLYTGHCTGEPGFALLQKYLGGRVRRLRAGERIALGVTSQETDPAGECRPGGR